MKILTDEQLSGCACVVCGRSDRPMVPEYVDTPTSTMVFRCSPDCCVREETLRQRHQVGRHLMAFADGGADWCRRCGTFDCYVPTIECTPVPRAKRYWPQARSAKPVA